MGNFSMVQILVVWEDGLCTAQIKTAHLSLPSLVWAWLFEAQKCDYNNTHVCRSAVGFCELLGSRSDPSLFFATCHSSYHSAFVH